MPVLCSCDEPLHSPELLTSCSGVLTPAACEAKQAKWPRQAGCTCSRHGGATQVTPDPRKAAQARALRVRAGRSGLTFRSHNDDVPEATDGRFGLYR